MAVAVSSDAVGAIEDRALVRNTFVLLPNGPLSAAPGDEFELSLTVTNMQRDAGEQGRVHLSLASSPHLTLTGETEFDLAIPEGKDHTLTILVRAAGPLGGAEIRFTASNGGETSRLASTMSIRPIMPYRVSLMSGAIKNKSVEIPVTRRLYDEFHTREVSLSYLPLGLAKGLSFYLNNYPYGCTEQIVSAAFPFLYPQLFREFSYTRLEAEAAIARVIGIVQARMKGDGTVGMWTSLSESDPMITVYTAHFLTEARNAGYYVPQSLLDRLVQTARTIAGQGSTHYNLSNRSYAISVLTLNEIITTPLVETLKRDISRGNQEAETELPGLFLAGSYALLQKNSDANALLARINRKYRRDSSHRYIDSLMYSGLYLTVLARHFPQRLRDLSEELFLAMAERLENQDYSTFSANFALMGVDAYLKAVPNADTGAYALLEILAENKRRELSAAGTTIFTAPFSAEAEKIRIESRDSLNLFYQITAAGFDLALPAAEIKNGVEVYREFLDSGGKVITSAKMGDLVTVRLTFRSLNNQPVSDVAVVDLFPAGLEAEIPSVRAASTHRGGANWTPDYVDIREDRLVLYGRVTPQASTFSYQTRAINTGSFTVPPLFAEAMYDKSVWALKPQENLRIGR
jgi:uncharacterized protein YfaS (alpha-2-macroglobulin family)